MRQIEPSEYLHRRITRAALLIKLKNPFIAITSLTLFGLFVDLWHVYSHSSYVLFVNQEKIVPTFYQIIWYHLGDLIATLRPLDAIVILADLFLLGYLFYTYFSLGNIYKTAEKKDYLFIKLPLMMFQKFLTPFKFILKSWKWSFWR